MNENKRQKCYRFVICLQLVKSHAFNEIREYSNKQMSTSFV